MTSNDEMVRAAIACIDAIDPMLGGELTDSAIEPLRALAASRAFPQLIGALDAALQAVPQRVERMAALLCAFDGAQTEIIFVAMDPLLDDAVLREWHNDSEFELSDHLGAIGRRSTKRWIHTCASGLGPDKGVLEVRSLFIGPAGECVWDAHVAQVPYPALSAVGLHYVCSAAGRAGPFDGPCGAVLRSSS